MESFCLLLFVFHPLVLLVALSLGGSSWLEPLKTVCTREMKIAELGGVPKKKKKKKIAELGATVCKDSVALFILSASSRSASLTGQCPGVKPLL